MPHYDACFPTPREDVFVAACATSDGSHLASIDLLPRAPKVAASGTTSRASLVALARWLGVYFADPLKARPDMVPIWLQGTQFQQRVWRQLQTIKVGQTRYYGDVSRRLSTSPRAVGNACRANPIALVVPCHRVVSLAGVGGYAGATSGWKVSVKQWLLAHEQGYAEKQ